MLCGQRCSRITNSTEPATEEKNKQTTTSKSIAQSLRDSSAVRPRTNSIGVRFVLRSGRQAAAPKGCPTTVLAKICADIAKNGPKFLNFAINIWNRTRSLETRLEGPMLHAGAATVPTALYIDGRGTITNGTHWKRIFIF